MSSPVNTFPQDIALPQTTSQGVSLIYDGIGSTVSTTPFDYFAHRELDILLIVIDTIFGVMAILGNLLTLTVLWKYKNLHVTTNTFIASLATSDLLFGLIAVPFALLTNSGLPEDFGTCLWMNSFIVFLAAASIFNLTAVSIDRYLAVIHPIWYRTTRHRGKLAVILITIAWVSAFIAGNLPLFGWNLGQPPIPRCYFVEVIGMDYLAFFFFAFILPPGAIILAIYARIGLMLRIRVSSKMKNTQSPAQQKQLNKEIRIVKFLIFLIVYFFVAWGPLLSLDTVMAFRGFIIPQVVVNITIFISHSNSAFNPILYAFMNRDIRRGFADILGKILCCKKSGKLAVSRKPAASSSGSHSGTRVTQVKQSYTVTDVKDNNETIELNPVLSETHTDDNNAIIDIENLNEEPRPLV